ncbi:zf-HC2 domain-containing protein [Micromonospora sp. NPDC050980]|uniref:zf-HC2 domain-containing protein n=1 Tax=Micromonospora sp. NPDC050980 TaxID=3155161 RepID=UPI0033C3D76D
MGYTPVILGAGHARGDAAARPELSCAGVRAVIDDYRTGALGADTRDLMRTHLDECADCRQQWRRSRWGAARTSALYGELAGFLGDGFVEHRDTTQELVTAWDQAAPRTDLEIRRFYRTTQAYLYDQVLWHASGTRPNYVAAALPILQAHPGPVLDWGCGIGVDLLRMHQLGLNVWGCELPSPPRDFLIWRARHHGYHRPIVDPGNAGPRAKPTVLWLIDTLDHLRDPQASLGALLDTVDVLITERYVDDPRRGRLGFHFRRPLSEIAELLAEHGLHPQQQRDEPVLLSVWSRARRGPAQPGPATHDDIRQGAPSA